MNALIEFFARRHLFVNLITIGVIVVGCITFLNLRREAFPNVDFGIVSVSVLYLGASPLEIEKLITLPLERELSGVDGIKKINSRSIENLSEVTITLDPDVTEKSDTLDDIRNAINRVKVEFPEETKEPTIVELTTETTPVIEIALFFDKAQENNEIWLKEYDSLSDAFLYGDTLSSQLSSFIDESHLRTVLNKTFLGINHPDQATVDDFLLNGLSKIIDISFRLKLEFSQDDARFYLRELAWDLENALEKIDDISSVSLRGLRKKEIHIELDPAKLAKYNIAPDQVMNAITSRNINKPGGRVVDKNKEYTIRTVQEFNNLEEIYNTYIRSNDIGASIQLRDIAHIKYELEEEIIREKANGNTAIILTVLKKRTGDEITLVTALKEKLKKFESGVPRNISLFVMNDFSHYVKRRLDILSGNIQFGMFFVILSLLFFLGWRVALMVALGIPFSFAITVLIMGYFDISINLISMFGLIVVAGIVVDDAIIVGENVYSRIEKGESPLRAAIEGTKEMLAPVFASVSTTICAFAPLMFMSGVMGKFIFYLPAVVIIALFASLLESFLILPSHLFEITKNVTLSKKNEKERLEFRIFNFFQKIYHPIIIWVIEYRYWMVSIILSVFIGSIFLLKILGFVLFPKVGVETFFIKLESEKGISLNEMESRIRFIEDALASFSKDDIESFQARVGILQEDVNDPFAESGKNYAQMNVYLTPSQTREKKANEIINYLKLKLDQKKPILYSYYDSNLEILYTLSYDSSLRVYSYVAKLSSLKLINTIELFSDYVLGGGFLNKETFVFYTSDFRLMSKNIVTGDVHQIIVHDTLSRDNVLYFKVLPKHHLAFIVSEKGEIHFISLENGKRIEKLSALRKGKVQFVVFSKEEDQLIVAREQGLLEIYDIKDGEISKKFHIDFSKEFNMRVLLNHVSFSINQKKVYVALSNGYFAVVDLLQESLVETKSFKYTSEKIDVDWIHEVSMGGQIKLCLSTGKKLYVVEPESLSLNQVFDFPDVTISDTILLGFDKDVLYFFTQFRGRYALNLSKVGVSQNLREDVPFKKLFQKVEYVQQSGGPPVGKPVSIQLRGDSFEVLRDLSKEVQEILYSTDYVFDIQDSWKDGGDEFHLVLDEKKASIAGVSVSQIANTIQMAFDGRVVTSIKEIKEEINIRVLFPERLRKNLDTLKQVRVSNKVGNLVSIKAFASFKSIKGVSYISHIDEERTLFVQANLDETKTNSLNVNRNVLKKMKPIMQQYAGYTIKAGGEYEDTQESLRSLIIAFIFGFVGILCILLLLYGNLIDPIIVLLIIPLSIVGVIVAFCFHKVLFLPELSFSFMAMMGVIGLTGILVNDSIILIDRINRLRKQGNMTSFEAIIQGSKDRLRAVILTTITTVFGIFPIAYGIGGSDPFLKPMALAMGWGLVFATMVTLLVVPTLYALFHRISRNSDN